MKTKNIERKTYHCPNCGGEVVHTYNHRCSYCGGMLDFNEPDAIELKPEDLVNISLREIFQEPCMNKIILIFDGYKCAMPKVYEYDGKNNYVSKVEEYVNPPKCGFCIEIDKWELEQYGLGYLKDRIYNTGIRFNEIDRVMQQVLDNKEIRFLVRY